MALLRNKITVIVILSSMVACNSNADHKIMQMDGADYLRPSKSFDEDLAASHLFVFQDSIEVYQLPYSSGGPVLGFKKIGSNISDHWGTYGPDEGCIMDSQISRNGDLILLNDFIKKQIWVLSVSGSGLELASGPIDSKIKSQCILPISDNECIYLNPHSFKSGKQRILLSKHGFRPALCLHDRFNYMNVLHGSIATNGNGKYVFVDHITSHIELINESGHQYMVIEKDIMEQQDYHVDSHELVFKGFVCRSFVDVCPYNDGFIALYRPGIFTIDSVDNSEESEVFAFDWEGNQLAHYKINAKVDDLSVSGDGRIVFCWECSSGINRLSCYEL